MREDLLVFERTYGVPSEVFYAAYQQGEEAAEQAWVLDWSEWAATYKIFQDRLDYLHMQRVKQETQNYFTLAEVKAQLELP